MRPVRQLKPWKVGADQPDAEAGGDQVLEVPVREPFVADEGPPGPQRIGAAGVREQCGGNFAFPDLRAGLETSWETALQAVAEAQAELARRQALRPKTLTSAERAAILASATTCTRSGTHLPPPTRTASNYCTPLLDEVNITGHRDRSQGHADIVLRWKGGALSELTTPPSASHQRSAPMRTPSAWSAA